MFLTKEDYRIAESNGISHELADERYYDQGWEKERAITKRVNIKHVPVERCWTKYKHICDANGIKQKTFYKRMERGASAEEASTLPLDTKYHKRSS